MKRKGFAYLDTIACVLVIAAVCMAFTGFWPNQDNPYKSYSLQAMAWLNGRLDLGQDYPSFRSAIMSASRRFRRLYFCHYACYLE